MSNVVNKEETIRKVAARLDNFTQGDVKTVLNTLRDVIYEEISVGNSVKPFEGVTFSTFVRPARTCRNPKTGEKVNVEEKTFPRCTFGKYAKDSVADAE